MANQESKAKAIREYLRKHPRTKPANVVKGLAAEDVHVTAKYVRKIKSGSKKVPGHEKSAAATQTKSKRSRKARPYPASSFTDALPLGEAIMKHAAGERVRRLTLLQKMDKSPNSSATKMMITNSGKCGITTGSYAAEYLELTEQGRVVVDSSRTPREKREASFELAIAGFKPFILLYELRLPVVQLIRKADRLPFDVNQARTLVFDTSDIYTLVPKLQTYRSEIATQARKALEDPESVGNPISVFLPDFYK